MQNNKVLEFMEDFTSLDVNRLTNWFIEESIVWIPPSKPVTTKARVLALFRAIFNKFEKVEWKIVEIHEVSPGRFFYVCDSWGSMKDCPDYKNRVATDITFNADGKIINISDYFKDTAVFLKK